MPRHVKMNMTCNATFEIKLVGGPTIGFNGGPADLKPSQWLDLERRLEAMTPDDACAYLDHAGWTRFGVDSTQEHTCGHRHDHGNVRPA